MHDEPYSERLGIIPPDRLQAALDRFDLGTLVSATLIPYGNFGQNLYLTATSGEWVFRGSPLIPGQFAAERIWVDLLHERTSVPVPWPYRYESSSEIFGWPWVIMPRMPGLPPQEIGLASDHPERRQIVRRTAETLVELQRLTWPEPALVDRPTARLVPLPTSWTDHIFASILADLERAQKAHPRTTDADLAWVRDLLERSRLAMDVSFTPTFVMNDFKEDNARFLRTADGWIVSGVFDFMSGMFGDGEADLSRQAAVYSEFEPGLERIFLDRWRELANPRPGFEERFCVYMLQERASLWEFFQQPGRQPYWNPDMSFRDYVEPFLWLT